MAADAKRASRPHPPQMVKCPRCNSSETKFCYYNNYSTTQPRYFCKNCKRYWTDGGTLRNVPVGGGLRKNKRSKTKLNTVLSSPPPTAMHQSQAPSLMPCDNLGGASNSFIPGHVGLPNPNPDVNLGLPLPPNYLLFNPGNYEMDNKSAPITNHLPLYQSDPNIVQHFASPLPLPVLSAGLKNDSALSGAYFTAYPWHQERAMPDSLQAAGGYVSRNENPSASYTVNNFLNVSDWQQISEGLAGAAGDDNHALMQLSQRPQWTDFAAGTRL